MPNYCFHCEVCDESKDVFRPVKDHNLPEICQCGKRMKRNYQKEHHAVRGDYKEPIVSEAMAFDAIDLGEHRKRFPDIEVQVDHARSARPIFKSLGQKRAYLKARGFIDCNSYV